jgi:hypothetical protein
VVDPPPLGGIRKRRFAFAPPGPAGQQQFPDDYLHTPVRLPLSRVAADRLFSAPFDRGGPVEKKEIQKPFVLKIDPEVSLKTMTVIMVTMTGEFRMTIFRVCKPLVLD